MSRKKVAFIVYVELDEMPGTMHTKQSAQDVIRNVLYQRMPSYKPTVIIAPKELQPERSKSPRYNVERKIEA